MGKQIVRYTLVYLSILMFLIPFIVAQPPVTTVQYFPNGYVIVESQHEYLKQGQNYQYNFFLYNYSTGYLIDNSSINCTFYLANSSGEIIFIENIKYLSEGYWEVDINGSNFLNKGSYPYGVSCQDDSGGSLAGIFRVTLTGYQLTESKSILYIGFLSLLVLIFFLNFYGMGYLPGRNIRDEDGRIMSISYLKYFRNILWMTGYFLFIGIVYIASNLAFAFLEEELVANTLFMIFRVAFGLAPVILIVWLIWIFASMFHDIQFQRMLNRGIFPGSNL